jgi:hypothetical protein
MIRKIQPFDYENCTKLFSGKVIPLKTFFELYDNGKVNPYKGIISEVLLDGYVTNILIENWEMYQVDEDCEIMSLIEFKMVDGKKELYWIEKK